MSILECNNGQHYHLKEMLEYITDPSKTTEDSIFHYSLSKDNFYRDFMITKYIFNKFDPQKRQYYQFILSLPEKDVFKDTDINFSKTVCVISQCLNRWNIDRNPLSNSPQFHVVSAIHIDKDPILHAHIIVNNVSFIDGHFFPWDKRLFWIFRNIVNQTLKYYGFTGIADERLNERSKLTI